MSLRLVLSSVTGATPQIQYKMRGHKKFYDIILERIAMVRKMNIDLKINTLVTDINKEEILKIGRLIQKYNVSQWSIFQFNPVNRGAIYKDLLDISDDCFGRIEKQIKLQRFPMKIKFSWKKKEGKS